MSKAYVLTTAHGDIAAGTTVYDLTCCDYGLANDDTRATGVKHKSVTLKPDGDYPSMTVPECQLQPITAAPECIIPTDEDAVHCMRQYGGSFIKHLADCWLVADVTNKARLKLAFEPEFDRYREHAGRTAKGPAHYIDMAREAADRTGEEVLPEHRA